MQSQHTEDTDELGYETSRPMIQHLDCLPIDFHPPQVKDRPAGEKVRSGVPGPLQL